METLNHFRTKGLLVHGNTIYILVPVTCMETWKHYHLTTVKSSHPKCFLYNFSKPNHTTLHSIILLCENLSFFSLCMKSFVPKTINWDYLRVKNIHFFVATVVQHAPDICRWPCVCVCILKRKKKKKERETPNLSDRISML